MDLEPYDVVFILGKDRILDPLSWKFVLWVVNKGLSLV